MKRSGGHRLGKSIAAATDASLTVVKTGLDLDVHQSSPAGLDCYVDWTGLDGTGSASEAGEGCE